MKPIRQQLFNSLLRILASVIVLVGSFDLFLKLIEVLEVCMSDAQLSQAKDRLNARLIKTEKITG